MRQRFGPIAALAVLLLAVLALFSVTFDRWTSANSEAGELAGGSSAGLLSSVWPGLIGLSLLLGILTYLSARRLAARSLQPIEIMRRELESITSSNPGGRVTVAPTGDEVEQLGLTLNETLDRLEQAVLANERLVADAAHELRTPLTAVRAALEVENNRAPRELLEESVGEIDRAGKLIDDLLLLARGPSTEARLELVDLDDIVNLEVRRLERQHPDIAIERAVQPVQQRLAREAICSVVRNLLENAAKYGNGWIKVSLGEQDQHSLLVVEDNGPGIPIAERDSVLRRFARLDQSRDRSTGGSGLGLAIVTETVDAHRGALQISDAPLGGCQVAVLLPMAVAARSPAAVRAAVIGTDVIGRPQRTSRRRLAVAALAVAVALAGSIGAYVVQRSPTDSADALAIGGGVGDTDPNGGAAGRPLDRSGWTASASTYFDQEIPGRAIDGDLATRWATGRYQADENMWFEIDLGSPQEVRRIELELSSIWAQDYPRGYRVQLAPEAGDFGAAVAEDLEVEQTFPATVIEFEPQTARRIRITQIGTSEVNWWSIAELDVFG